MMPTGSTSKGNGKSDRATRGSPPHWPKTALMFGRIVKKLQKLSGAKIPHADQRCDLHPEGDHGQRCEEDAIGRDHGSGGHGAQCSRLHPRVAAMPRLSLRPRALAQTTVQIAARRFDAFRASSGIRTRRYRTRIPVDSDAFRLPKTPDGLAGSSPSGLLR